MSYIGQHLILRMNLEGVYLNGDICVPYFDVTVGDGGKYSPRQNLMWLPAEVISFSDGTLECRIGEHQPDRLNSFFSQNAGVGTVTKLILTGDSVLEKLTGGGIPIPDWGLAKINRSVSPPKAERQKPEPQPVPLPVRRTIPEPEARRSAEYPIHEYAMEYTYRFHEMRVVDGAALFKADFTVPKYFRPVQIELRIENDFLRPEYDTIKGYLSNVLKRTTVEVTATIRCQGPDVVSVEAKSPLVSQITADLLDEVKYRYIKRELKEAADKTVLVTVDDLFEKVKESGLQPSDRQFVDDLVAIKKLKHAEQMQYLSGLHLYDLIKLRIQTKPFAFVCFVSGKRGCFFVLETPDKKDATYLWRLDATEEDARQNRRLISDFLALVEQEISLIRDHGREPYRKDKPDNFSFIEHDYKSADGFATWKAALHRVLDGEERE